MGSSSGRQFEQAIFVCYVFHTEITVIDFYNVYQKKKSLVFQFHAIQTLSGGPVLEVGSFNVRV